ncbi:TRAP transporter small permease [Aureimonas fodinaquatilis]|uniref:TRAP transporter small permease n=1 Tax=Aureimonas fodinaquatilis TaxID=2565783 RepID=UPI001AEECDA6|nr:TRAP transporter small permease [Aureimonas fodinaquatilis]
MSNADGTGAQGPKDMLKLEKLLGVFVDLLGIVLIAGVLLNFSNAVMRYGFGASFVWAEEIMIFGLILIVMAGIVVITIRYDHLRIDAISPILPDWVKAVIRIMISLIICGVLAYIAVQSLTIVQLMMRLGQTSVAARIPMWIPHSFLLVSFSLAAMAALYRAGVDLRQFLSKQTNPAEETVN